MSTRQIAREIKILEGLKILKKTNRFLKKNVKTSSNYEILINGIVKPSEQGGTDSQSGGGTDSQSPQELYPDYELNNTLSKDREKIIENPIDKDEKKSANAEEAGASQPLDQKKEYGNTKINILDTVLKKECSVIQWRETESWQRRYLFNLVRLADKLGHQEFLARVNFMRKDAFHRQKLGSLEYLYRTIRSLSGTYVENY